MQILKPKFWDKKYITFSSLILLPLAIIYQIIFGIKKAQKDFPETIFNYMVPLGVLIFTVTGLISLSKGFNFLDYDALAHYPKHGQHIGIIAIELGVFVTVIGSMVSIFFAFVARGKK